MKPHGFAFRNQYFRQTNLWLVLFVAFVIILGCAPAEPVDNVSSNEPEPLQCKDCELVDVIGVKDADTLITSIGEIHMYGAYVIDQPADCAALAEERVRDAAGNSIRIEPGPEDSVRIGTNHYYLYTRDGFSIEQQLVEEGLALIWTQDGQHLGWFVYLDAAAKKHDSGCLWHDYQAFQRGEPNEFRILGLTYRD